MESKVVGDGFKENPFKLFIPPRVNYGPVSAVRPQEVVNQNVFMQNSNACHEDEIDVSFLMTNTPKLSKTGNQEFVDPILLKPQKMHIMEKENTEHINQLYTKLFQEAEKIKRWILSIENELWQKDKKLQENKQTIEVQRKAIQEQQFENENLSMKLEEEISKNEEATKIHNATREMCSLVNESSSRLAEKIKSYESERDEAKRLYTENAENIERIIMAFEELRIQAENTRLEIILKLKEETEQREQLKNKYQHQLNDKENEVQRFQRQYKQKDTELHETWINLKESKIKCDQLEEATRHLSENLQELHAKEQNLTTELEKTKDLLSKTENAQKSLEEELESAMKVIIQVTKEKESKFEEFDQLASNSASTIDELRYMVKDLEESFRTEQQRSKQAQETLQMTSLELEKKTAILGELENLKIDNELKINKLTETLEKETEIKEKLKEELANEKLKRGKYSEELETEKKIQNDLHDRVEKLVHKIEDLQRGINEFMKENADLKETVESKENILSELQRQIANALAKEKEWLEKINILKTELEEERLRHDKLYSDFDIVLAEKETLSLKINSGNAEIKGLQNKLENFEYKEEMAKKEMEALQEQNNQKEEKWKALENTLKQQDQLTVRKLGEKEENLKNLQNEVKKKEKLLKTMESKLNSLKKQLENKNISAEELNQENKSLKIKFIEETKQSSVYKTERNQLNLELTHLSKKNEETIQGLQKEIEELNLEKEKLTEEAKTLKITAETTLKTQKETEIMCQNKITEMVTLMEKHKHQYDKMVDEKDAELNCWKEKQLNINLCKKTLEEELTSLKGELLSVKQQLKLVTGAKKVESNYILTNPNDSVSNCEISQTPVRKISLSAASKSAELSKKSGITRHSHTWTPSEKARIFPNHQTYTIKTPPFIQNQILKGNMKPPSKAEPQKKRKVILDLDTHSDSSEQSDLLSMIPESEMFKELYKGNSEAACLFTKPQQQTSLLIPISLSSAHKVVLFSPII
ncbi:synaptonemal complex protein 1 isoform X2 [Narcine bancroftii]|uniref:synaptonemal complex protein 1 isoform X2 n=1 Tax=Narcine bancroftii TaxID=1343680 RepID=UPI003831C125